MKPAEAPASDQSVQRPVFRVLHVDHTDEHGGAELALARLLRADPGWESTLLLPTALEGRGSQPGPFDERVEDNAQVIREGPPSVVGASQLRNPLSAVRFAVDIARRAVAVGRVARRVRPDVIWSNSSRAALYASLVPRRKSTMLVVHLRDRVDSGSLGKAGALVMQRLVLPRADAVISNSGATLDSAKGFLRSGVPVAVVPSPSGIVRAEPKVTAPSSSVTTPQLRIGMVARLDPWKGQHLLISAVSSLLVEGAPRVSLHLAGAADFGHDHYLEKLQRQIVVSGLEGVVFLEGRISDVNGFIDRMDICVQYSTRPEPLGQNVLQYLSRGKATVVAAEGGPTEWVRDGVNGLTVTPRSPEALAQTLSRLIEDDDLRARLARGAAATRGLLTDKEVAEASLRFLEDCLSRRSD